MAPCAPFHRRVNILNRLLRAWQILRLFVCRQRRESGALAAPRSSRLGRLPFTAPIFTPPLEVAFGGVS
eukprot:3952001-Prorocentrum_lima.AAC.1